MSRCDLYVTGAGGFVGRHVMARAASAGLHARAADGDQRDAPAVERRIAAEQPRAVIHLAAPRRGGDPWTTLVDELSMARSVLAAVARHAPDAPVLLAGSAAQYGLARAGTLGEDDPTAPVSAYGSVKAVLERTVTAPPLHQPVRVIFTRSFNHIGPGQGLDAPAAQWAAQVVAAEAAGGGTLRTGNLDVVRDFLDVRDIADAYLALVRSPAAGIVNVCSGVPVRVGRIAELLISSSTVAVGLERDLALLRAVDPPFVVGEPARLRELTGWSPRIALEQSVADLLDARRRGEVTNPDVAALA